MERNSDEEENKWKYARDITKQNSHRKVKIGPLTDNFMSDDEFDFVEDHLISANNGLYSSQS